MPSFNNKFAEMAQWLGFASNLQVVCSRTRHVEPATQDEESRQLSLILG